MPSFLVGSIVPERTRSGIVRSFWVIVGDGSIVVPSRCPMSDAHLEALQVVHVEKLRLPCSLIGN